ncbi:MAG: FtsQ-type POTRA domain-containing protein [Patescibacteria group bacterium]
MNYKSYISTEKKHKRRFWRRRPSLPLPHGRNFGMHPRITRGTLRNKISAIGFVIISIVWGSALVFHPYFRIRHIEITGTSNIDRVALTETVETALSRARFRIIPQNNFFLLDRVRLETVLKTKFPIDTVVITKNFPNSIHLGIAERLAFVILDNGEQYTLVDEEGIPQKTLRPVAIHERIERASTTLHYPDVPALYARYGTYPVLYDKRNEKLDPALAQSVMRVYSYLGQHTDFATHHFVYPQNEYQTLLVVHRDGVTVAFNPVEKLDEQLETFRNAWQRELRKEKGKDVRINARYPGRVYIEE